MSPVLKSSAYNACVHSVLLYASETWPTKVEDINRLSRNEKAMIRWTCSARLSDRRTMSELRRLLGLPDVGEVIRWGHLRWYGHVLCMNTDRWPKKILNCQIDSTNPQGRPAKRLINCINNDLREVRIDPTMVTNREKWRRAIRPEVT